MEERALVEKEGSVPHELVSHDHSEKEVVSTYLGVALSYAPDKIAEKPKLGARRRKGGKIIDNEPGVTARRRTRQSCECMLKMLERNELADHLNADMSCLDSELPLHTSMKHPLPKNELNIAFFAFITLFTTPLNSLNYWCMTCPLSVV